MDELVQNFLETSLQDKNIDLLNYDSDSEQETESIKMALINAQQLDAMVNSLKLPDCIKDLPKFNGNKHTLHEFLENVQEIITTCGNTIPRTFLRAIRNKIVDNADEVLIMYGTPLDWDQIKENLTTHYADKRDETSLIRDLHTLYQGSDNIEKFFSRVIDVQSTLINHVKIREQTQEIIKVKETLYKKICLAAFLAGIKEPMGSMIRARNPENLAEAFSLCLSEQNIHYIRNRNFPFPNNNTNLNRKPLPQLPVKQTPYLNNDFNKLQRPYNNSPVLNAHNTYYNHRPFPKPQQFQPNYPQAPKPKVYQKTEPMDTRSNENKYRQPTRFPQQPNWQLYNMELNPSKEEDLLEQANEQEDTSHIQDLDEYQDYEPETEPDETFFHHPASENPSGT